MTPPPAIDLAAVPSAGPTTGPGAAGPAVAQGTAPAQWRGASPRVALIAEQRLVGEAVRVALASRGLTLVVLPWPAPYQSPQELRRRVASHRCRAGIVVADLDSPRRREDAHSLISAVALPWLVLVGTDEEAEWGALVHAGAAAILPLSVGLDDLVAALASVLAGKDALGRERRQELMFAWIRDAEETRRALTLVARLTPREREVLDQLYDGRSVRDIAASAGATEQTVRSQVKAVLRKLEVRSQLAAVAVLRRTMTMR